MPSVRISRGSVVESYRHYLKGFLANSGCVSEGSAEKSRQLSQAISVMDLCVKVSPEPKRVHQLASSLVLLFSLPEWPTDDHSAVADPAVDARALSEDWELLSRDMARAARAISPNV